MSFADGEKRVDVVFHHYLNPHHLFLYYEDLKCCCKSFECFMNTSNTICNSQCDTYFRICFKENSNNMNSEVCFKTTKQTGDNTTLMTFTTPNIVKFIVNNEYMTLKVILLTFMYKIYMHVSSITSVLECFVDYRSY